MLWVCPMQACVHVHSDILKKRCAGLLPLALWGDSVFPATLHQGTLSCLGRRQDLSLSYHHPTKPTTSLSFFLILTRSQLASCCLPVNIYSALLKLAQRRPAAASKESRVALTKCSRPIRTWMICCITSSRQRESERDDKGSDKSEYLTERKCSASQIVIPSMGTH